MNFRFLWNLTLLTALQFTCCSQEFAHMGWSVNFFFLKPQAQQTFIPEMEEYPSFFITFRLRKTSWIVLLLTNSISYLFCQLTSNSSHAGILSLRTRVVTSLLTSSHLKKKHTHRPSHLTGVSERTYIAIQSSHSDWQAIQVHGGSQQLPGSLRGDPGKETD